MNSSLAATLESLDDIALAILTTLIASQHLIIRAPASTLSSLDSDISRIASFTFSFTCASITCTSSTTVNDFSEAIILDSSARRDNDELDLDTRRIANIVVARDLDLASEDVQIQALEVMRQRRALSHTALHAAPNNFLFIALLSNAPPTYNTENNSRPTPTSRGLIKHLNDHFFISHVHDPDTSDSSSLLSTTSSSNDTASISSATGSQTSILIHSPPTSTDPPPISPSTIATLQQSLATIRTTAEIRRYAHDILTYLRLHRCVAGGVSAIAARHLDALARVLALLHGLDYVTPALVQLAARKVLRHRVVLATAATERSVQWGSARGAVRAALVGVEAGEVVEDVLGTVPCPL
ncbi:hypothetical protein FH972_022813 [Carpinus fangiana]|uniref:magnesium chelatase n=1 Tax=Carpinus fangiana TaxID=176857 RepID=A0A5N6KVJ9_9ROSI|nr:hypothetical protein FH972_022813 [Carpinus fangiana]